MLVLKREDTQQIMIGDDITVTLVRSGEGWAHIGIDAPKEVPVHRLEVYEAIQRKKRQQQAEGDSDA